MVDEEIEKDDAPARGYLIGAGIPAGLLLWLGSKWVLKRVGGSEEYQKNAAETLSALEWLQGIGLAVAMFSSLALLWALRRMIWREKK